MMITKIFAQKIDHIAVYVTIVGMWTPLFLIGDGANWRSYIIAMMWIYALLGIVYKIFYFDHLPLRIIRQFNFNNIMELHSILFYNVILQCTYFYILL